MATKSIDYKKLGEILQLAREKAGYTQKEIAGLLTIKSQTVSAWENAKNKIDIDTLFFLCKQYRIDFNETLAVVSNKDEEIKNVFSFQEMTHIEKYRTLDEHGQGTVDVILDREYERCTRGAPSEEVDNELEAYRLELEAEQKGGISSVSEVIKRDA
jgi:transcriptional regulator with XRE-family HTH domain